MGEARKRRDAIARGEPDPLPQNAGITRSTNAKLTGKRLSAWISNRAQRRRETRLALVRPAKIRPPLSAPFTLGRNRAAWRQGFYLVKQTTDVLTVEDSRSAVGNVIRYRGDAPTYLLPFIAKKGRAAFTDEEWRARTTRPRKP